jgi:uncharacterized membrane protein YczE
MRIAIAITILTVIAAVLLAVLIGDVTLVGATSVGLIIGWSMRISKRRPRR